MKIITIIHELGRGTWTYDEYISSQKKSFCLFATHFHELSALATLEPSVVNKHVTAEFNKKDDILTMLYKINDGPCPQSYGISVAKMAKFSDKIIKIANIKAKQLESIGKSAISLLSYKSIEKILKKKELLLEKAKKNNWNENNEEYQDEEEKLMELIDYEMTQNKEFDD